MSIQIPDNLLAQANLTPEELLIEIATHLYDLGRLSMGQARKLARIDQILFQKELSKRNINIKYSEEDLMDDLKTIEELKEL